MTKFLKFAGFAALALIAGTGQAQSTKKTPYWASISQPEARMRTGTKQRLPGEMGLQTAVPAREGGRGS